jgi:AraC-like DNA-binding protein
MTVNPDTVHWGSGVGENPWEQHILFIDEGNFADTIEELTGRRGHDRFSALSLDDTDLWRCFRKVHVALTHGEQELERGDLLLGLFSDVMERSGNTPGLSDRGSREPRAVRLAREWLDEHFAENISLDQLAALSGVSAFQLSRAFRKSIGLPPHAYQVHRRIRAAENLLRNGYPPADVAADCGFSDQAHLTRVFRQANGMTPAQFRAG